VAVARAQRHLGDLEAHGAAEAAAGDRQAGHGAQRSSSPSARCAPGRSASRGRPASSGRSCARSARAPADGVLLADAEDTRHVPAAEAGDIVDATGAGDAFAGTLAARLAHGWSLDDAAGAAADAAARSLGARGGTGWIAGAAR
jgi:hypothetical protein